MDATSGVGGGGVVTQTLKSRQDFTTSVIKKQAEADQKSAEILASAAEDAAKQGGSGKTRGSIIDIQV